MEKEKPKLVFFNGEIVPYEKALIHAMTPCVKYGALIFEGIRCYWNDEEKQLYVFRLEDHSRRLLQSAKLARMDHDYTVEYVSNSIIRLLKQLEYKEDLHIRQMMYLDGDGQLSATKPVGMTAVALPRGRSSGFGKGLNVSISSWRRIDDTALPPRIKAAANYQNGRLGALQAKLDGYDSTIFLNAQGKVSEGPGACLFMVKDSQVVTPTVTSGILESITRKTLIKISSEMLKVNVIERDIDRTELYLADEVFFCGSGAEITPIVSVDRHVIGEGIAGAYTLKLRELYLDVTRGKVKEYSSWLSPVY